ncbi:uncharacterized protein LOC111016967 isoform X2 [Momordica charantia]|nr:uncharacterized protein LOC111016967 isoform X2 [Momordica charantia]
MESVVATVSGYHGTERFNLIKMISYTGASYVGAMSRSITHLICWKLEGRKFSLAKKFKTIIVNHRWLEDCIRQGKRVPEGPYILQSGQSAGPLSIELPLAAKDSVSTTKYNVLSEKSQNCGNVEEQSIKSIYSFGAIWPRSCLLDKDLFSDFGKSDDTSHKSKHKLRKKISKQEDPSNSSSRNNFQEPTPSEFLEIERGSSSSLARDERKGENSNLSPTVKSSRRRRLLNRNTSEDHCKPDVWDFDPECYHLGTRNHGNNFTVLSCHLNNERDIEVVGIGGSSDHGLLCDEGGIVSDSFEGVEARENQFTSKDANLPVENAPGVLMISSEDELSNIDTLQKEIEDPAVEHNASLPTSAELSCVICWTDFSSMRGVLPCGHRFCYSCIQNWADHMASSRKISTCPLCKASFLSITKVEEAATSDQKIYSQTIPCGPSLLDIFILPDERTLNSGVQASVGGVCSACRCREPEDLLMSCHLCQIRHIHSYCLDPPLLPWTCIHCKDLQTLYHRSH